MLTEEEQRSIKVGDMVMLAGKGEVRLLYVVGVHKPSRTPVARPEPWVSLATNPNTSSTRGPDLSSPQLRMATPAEQLAFKLTC